MSSDELLAVDDGDPELLGLGRVNSMRFILRFPRSDTEDGPRSPETQETSQFKKSVCGASRCEREDDLWFSSFCTCGPKAAERVEFVRRARVFVFTIAAWSGR